MEKIPVIHIGMPKTATKTLQWRLFAGHRDIYYLGRYDGAPFRKQYRKFECCRTREVMALMQQIAYGEVFSPDFDACRKLFRMICAPAREGNLVPVWSWESYATDLLANRRVRARNLKQVFGEAKILMTLRNPVDLLESAYFQQLRRDNVGPRATFGRLPYCPEIDDWLKEEFDREVLEHLQYPETIQAYVDQFGLKSVHVSLFEDILSDHDSFFGGLCDVMGIDAAEGIRLVKGRADNSRWTVRQIEKLKEVVDSPVKSALFRCSRRIARRRMLDLDKGGVPLEPGKKAKARISDAWRKAIYEKAQKGNQWLQETFGLPLEKYGYFGREESA